MPKTNFEIAEPESLEQQPVRDRLLAVAAVHFAEHGLQGASQRAIQREVGVNPGAANYYFRSKEALYLSVIENALEPILEKRRDLLKAMPAEADWPERLRYLLGAYLGPMIRMVGTREGHSYLRIVGQQFSHADIALDAMERSIADVRELYVDLLSKMFPEASRNRIYQVLRICVSLCTAIPPQYNPEDLNTAKIDAMVDDIIELSVMAFQRMCDPAHP